MACDDRLAAMPERLLDHCVNVSAETIEPLALHERPDESEHRPPLSLLRASDAGTERPARFRFASDTEIEQEQPPPEIVARLLPQGALAQIFGPPESLKSFFALALSFCLATGTAFAGRAVRRGLVLYVAAEGGGGLGKRVRAWKAALGLPGPAGVFFLKEPVALMEQREVGRFVAALKTLPESPTLIVFDTLAWCMTGGDENAQRDMGLALEGMRVIRDASGATVLIVHHTRLDGERERGSTSNRAGMDVMFSTKRDGDRVVVTCEKSKDAPPFEPFRLEFVASADSRVLIGAESAPHLEPERLSEKQRAALTTLHRCFPDDSASASDWRDVAGLAKRTFFECASSLRALGYVAREGQGRGARWRMTEPGIIALGARCGDGAEMVRRTDGALVRADLPLLGGRTTAPSAPGFNRNGTGGAT